MYVKNRREQKEKKSKRIAQPHYTPEVIYINKLENTKKNTERKKCRVTKQEKQEQHKKNRRSEAKGMWSEWDSRPRKKK